MAREHPDLGAELKNLALLLKDTDRLDRVEALLRLNEVETSLLRAIDIYENSFPQDPAVGTELARLLGEVQAAKRTNGAEARLTEVETALLSAIDIHENSSPQDPAVGTELARLLGEVQAAKRTNGDVALGELALLLMDRKPVSELESLLLRTVDIYERSVQEEHPDIATELNALAQLLRNADQLRQAEQLMRRALYIDELNFGREHPTVARDLNNLALVVKDMNRPTEAEALMSRVLYIDERNPESPRSVEAWRSCQARDSSAGATTPIASDTDPSSRLN